MAQTPTGFGFKEGQKKDKNFRGVEKYFVKLEIQCYITVSGAKNCTLAYLKNPLFKVLKNIFRKLFID